MTRDLSTRVDMGASVSWLGRLSHWGFWGHRGLLDAGFGHRLGEHGNGRVRCRRVSRALTPAIPRKRRRGLKAEQAQNDDARLWPGVGCCEWRQSADRGVQLAQCLADVDLSRAVEILAGIDTAAPRQPILGGPVA